MKHRTKAIILIAVVITIIAGIVGYSLYIDNRETKSEDVVEKYNEDGDLEIDENGKVVDSDTEENRLDKATDYLKNVLVTMYRIDEEHPKADVEAWLKEISTDEFLENYKNCYKDINSCVITEFAIPGKGTGTMKIEGKERKTYSIYYTGKVVVNGQEKTLELGNVNTETGENCGKLSVYYDDNNKMVLCYFNDNV